MKFEDILPGLRAGATAWQTSREYGGKADGTRVYWRLDDAADTADGRRFHITTEYPREPSGRVPKSSQPYELTLKDLERDDWEFGYYEAGIRESRPKEESEQTRIKELIVAARYCSERPRVASAIVFAVNTEAFVASYYVNTFEVVGRVGPAILDKLRNHGFFGDQDARAVRVDYWETKVETRKQVNFLPRTFKVLGVIY